MLDVSDDAYDDPVPFDVVCAFEVLEHLEHDSEAIRGWLRHLRPGGHILLSVPAGRNRFGAWDRRAGHYRRYDHADIVAAMRLAGLSAITTISYGFPLGRALEMGRNAVAGVHATGRSMEERTASSGRQYQPPPWTASATRVTSFPFRLLQRPFSNGSRGTGIVARGLLDDL
jgi:SAM-dependent methyltransferase